MGSKHRSGVVLAMVLILGLLLSTAVVSFSRRSIIDCLVSRNRDNASQAEALARGGLQVALALLLEDALAGKAAAEKGDSSNAGDTLDDIWALVGDTELVTPEGDTLTVHIRDAGSRLVPRNWAFDVRSRATIAAGLDL